MNDQQILEELISLLESKGVIIRSEPLGGTGGALCKLKGQTIFFVDTQASSGAAAVICAAAVAELVDIENVYILPGIREFIEHYGKPGQQRPK